MGGYYKGRYKYFWIERVLYRRVVIIRIHNIMLSIYENVHKCNIRRLPIFLGNGYNNFYDTKTHNIRMYIILRPEKNMSSI